MPADGIAAYGEGREQLEALIVRYGPLVRRIAHYLLVRLPQTVLVDDLIQAGMIGLIEASANYEPDKGASFETYAGIRIRGAMLDEIRKGQWAPRSVHRNARRVDEAIQAVERQVGREPRDVEIARKMGVSPDEYHAIVRDAAMCRLASFDDLGVDSDLGTAVANDSPGPLEGVHADAFKERLTHAIERLPQREQLVVSLYYDEELTLKEIGSILGVSESRISQIHSQAMRRLREALHEWLDARET